MKAKAKKANIAYLSRALTKEEKVRFKNWLGGGLDLEKLVLGIVDGGMKLSMSFDSYNDCYSASITRQPEDPKDPVEVLVGRGSSPLGALYGTLFRHYILFEGSWDFEETRQTDLDDV